MSLDSNKLMKKINAFYYNHRLFCSLLSLQENDGVYGYDYLDCSFLLVFLY
jgi:hypothetical protein